jgi:biopolymer transport protein ExbD
MSDIIFNLLLFFLLTASFAAETGLDLSLPKVVEPTVVQAEDVVVTLTRSGQVFIEDREVSWTVLAEELKGAIGRSAEHRVVVRGDEGVALGKVVEVMDAARRGGAEGLALAAESKDQGTKSRGR